MKGIIANEVEEPLFNREELSSPHLIIANYKIIIEDPKLVAIYKEK